MRVTLNQMIGQKLVTGFPSTRLTKEFINVVKKYKVGNVILFKENVESEEQLIRLCNQINELIFKETGIPPFITVDQEGGAVSRLPESAANIPGAMAIAATGDKNNAYLAGLVTARELRYFGMNFDLAPVVDVNSNPQNPIIGVRSYGDSPEQVIDYSLEMIRGLLEGGVLASVKHFPGHGDTEVDSHLDLPLVNKSYEELFQVELKPFIAAIEDRVPAVTTTHILFPQLDDSGRPATMSRAILTDLLRKKLKFHGLIISDCMEMKAIANHFGTVNGSLEAVRAGVDLVYVSHNAPLAGEVCKAIYQEALEEKISQSELRESFERILFYKKKLNTSIKGYDRKEAKSLSLSLIQKSICMVKVPKRPFVLGNHPISMGCPAVRMSLAGNEKDINATFASVMASWIGGSAYDYPVDPNDYEIASAISATIGHSSIIIGSYNAHLKQGQKKLIKELCSKGLPVAVLALRDPYDLLDLDENALGIAVFEYTRQAIEAAARVLTGKEKATGKLPLLSFEQEKQKGDV